MAVSCSPLEAVGEAAWDAFVAAAPAATFFHRAAWARVIGRAFGHHIHYTVALQDGAITGVLPLVHMKTRLFGNALVSTPFCVHGGPIAADAESAAALEAHAAGLMRRLSAQVLEFRSPGAGDWLVRDDLYVNFVKPIAGDAETNMKAIPRKQRAMVRKGIDNGLSSVIDAGVDRLHGLYAESVRNLGTPVFARSYFRLLMEAFAGSVDVVTVLDAARPIASVMNFYFRDQVLPYYGGGGRHARERAANDFMYWEVMRRAAERGYRRFDFGRSKAGTGAFAFKKNWGFVPETLAYRYRLAPGAALPDHNPLNPKYRLFIAAWKRLPVPLANVIGPRIVRGIG